jgi:hypothetical protein
LLHPLFKDEEDKEEGEEVRNAVRVPEPGWPGEEEEKMAEQKLPGSLGDLQSIALAGTHKARKQFRESVEKAKARAGGWTVAKMVRLFESEAAGAQGHSSPVGAKGRGQIKNLMGILGPEKTAELIRWTCAHWNVLKQELNANGLSPGFVLGFRDSLVKMMDEGFRRTTVGREHDHERAAKCPSVGWGKRKKKARG